MNIVSILAGGEGLRFNYGRQEGGKKIPKQLAKIGDKTLLEMSIEAFDSHPDIDKIIVVMNKNWMDDLKEILSQDSYRKVDVLLKGGDSRFESSNIAIDHIARHYPMAKKLLIHDGVRPFVSEDVISNVINALDHADAVEPVVKATETLVKLDEFGVPKTVNRRKYANVQTPQGFKFKILHKAFQIAEEYLHNSVTAGKISGKKKKWTPTDDMSVVEKFNPKAIRRAVQGDPKNKKVTFRSDLN
ncbi:MAG: 2-C-methyl-D-erythritol 4-phosphate cytidylyltransferase [Candidatus Ancillula sp.]|nr:2-C-methyl-D-erythritol 4-phosphate cytidylyltransferase [Candidatus Ancillula sp.]